MRVLAIDTALEACAVAVVDAARGVVLAHESVPMLRGHAEALMPMVQRVMEHAHLSFAALDRVAVTTGPGSFTGLRVGLAAARGIGLAAGKPVVGLTTLAAFAAPIIAADDSQPVVAAVDARHAHVYLQVYGPGGRTLLAPRLAPLAEAVRVSARNAPHLVGNAAAVLAASWPSDDPPPLAVHQSGAPDIDWVARLGVALDPATSPPKPTYLRAPDAQPQDAGQVPRR